MLGPPVAAVVAPLGAGLLAEADWRLAWLAFPFATSAAGALWVLRAPDDRSDPGPRARIGPLWGRPEVRSWLAGEWFAYAGWSAIPVFSGALLVESYGVSAAAAGLVIAVSAAAFVAGNSIARRHLDAAPRRWFAPLALTLAVVSALLGVWRSHLVLSSVLLAVVGLIAGGRTLLGSGVGLHLAGDQRVGAMALRAAAQQFGYLAGAGSGALVLGVTGYRGLGVQMAVLFLAAAVPHLTFGHHPTQERVRSATAWPQTDTGCRRSTQ